MKIKLELDDFRFCTTRDITIGEIRWLVVRIDGKPFAVSRVMNPKVFRSKEEDEFFDRSLIELMEMMLRKVFVDACAAVPVGKNLLEVEGR